MLPQGHCVGRPSTATPLEKWYDITARADAAAPGNGQILETSSSRFKQSPMETEQEDDFMHVPIPPGVRAEIPTSRSGRRRQPRPREMPPPGSLVVAQAGSVQDSEDRYADAPTTRAPIHYDTIRSVGLGTRFTVTTDDAVLLPDASVIPDCSNPPRSRRPSLFRSLSTTAKNFGTKFAAFARRRSDAPRPTIRHMRGSLDYDRRGYLYGFQAINDAVPVEEARRQRNQRNEFFAYGCTAKACRDAGRDCYSNAFPPARMASSGRVKRTLSEICKKAPFNNAEQIRSVGVFRETDQATRCCNFIGLHDSDSEEKESVSSRSTTCVAKISSHSSGSSIIRPMTPDPLSAQFQTERRPTLRRKLNPYKGLPTLPKQSTGQDSSAGGFDGVKLRLGRTHAEGHRDPKANDSVSSWEFGRMPKYADDAFSFDEEPVKRLIDRPDILGYSSPGQLIETNRHGHMLGSPPSSATGLDIDGVYPEMIIDTVQHDRHTSWWVTNTSIPDQVHSYRTSVADQLVYREPDDAARLMGRLEWEKMGPMPCRRSSSRR